MTIGDIYQLKLGSTLAAQTNLNVYHYLVVDEPVGSAAAPDLALEFESTILPLVAAVLGSNWVALAIDAVNLGDIADFVNTVLSPTVPGDRTGETNSPVVCWSFRYNRQGPGTRSGWKRHSGIAESDVAGQSAAAGIQPALDDLADGYGDDLAATLATYRPIVVSHPIILGTKPTVFYAPNGVDYLGVGSQVSRKRAFGT